MKLPCSLLVCLQIPQTSADVLGGVINPLQSLPVLSFFQTFFFRDKPCEVSVLSKLTRRVSIGTYF